MLWPGTTRSIERLVEAYYKPLFAYAYRLGGSAELAEDLTQETFCQAQLKWQQLRDPDKARPWLYAILRNLFLHRLRAEKQEQFVPLDTVGELPERGSEPLPAIEPELLQKALAELPEVFRTPVILFYFEDFSYRDIADAMELPLGTVMSRLARAKAFLRQRLVEPALAPGQEGGA